jgi:hypothetical protein
LAPRRFALGACGHKPGGYGPTAQLSERECMAAAMFFESNRSSDDGMLAVGTVVMNRLQSPKYPKSVCGVVGQHNQFAEGALTKHVNKRHSSWARAERAADAVLGGERHAGVGGAMFFHTAGYSLPVPQHEVVTLAGGNIFYDKRKPAPGAPAWPSAIPSHATSGGRAKRRSPSWSRRRSLLGRRGLSRSPLPARGPAPDPGEVRADRLATRSPAKAAQPVATGQDASAKRIPAFNPAQIASVLAKPRTREAQGGSGRGRCSPQPKQKPIVSRCWTRKPRSGITAQHRRPDQDGHAETLAHGEPSTLAALATRQRRGRVVRHLTRARSACARADGRDPDRRARHPRPPDP